MTQRLPIPGSDNGTWGDILNGFLEVSLNSDGTLSTTAVTSALPSPIPTTNLGSGTASSSTFLRGDSTWTTTPTGAVASVFGRTGVITAQSGDYTAAQVTGALQSSNNLSDLASTSTARTNLGLGSASVLSSTVGGDLSGTLPNPTVAKLQGTVLSAPAGGATSYLNATGGWSTPSGNVSLDSTASDIKALGTESAGSSSLASRADHVHPTTGLVRTATIAVAASNATASELAQADYVCTGTADQTTINTALTALTNGGTIHLSSGEFNLTAPIVFNATAQVVQGSGIASSAAGGTTINAASAQAAFEWNGISSIWFCSVQSLYIQSGTYGLYFVPLTTTVASGTGSDSIATIISAGALYVASVTGYPTSGTIAVVCTNGTAYWAYTGVNTGSNTFTWSGSPTVTYGGTATSASTTATGNDAFSGATFWDFYARDVFVYGTSSDGFYAYDGHGYVLDHFLAEGCGGYGVNFSTTYTPLSEPEVRNGTFKSNAGGGVYMGCPGGVVAECEFASITGTAILLKGLGSKATDNVIGVTTTGATGVGILMQASGAVAKGNIVNQCGSYGIETQTFGAIITDNCVYTNTGANIYLTQQSVVANNFVEFGSSYGIESNGATYSTITGNLVTGATLAGIYITGAVGCTVQGNIVEKNTQHGIQSTSDYTTIQGNTLLQNSTSVANSYDDINSSGNYAVVLGNTINGNSKSRYGVNFSGSATVGNVCAFNVITGESTASFGASTYAVFWDPPMVLSKTGSYSLAAIDTLVVFTLSGAGQTATLPSATTAAANRYYTINNANASTNALGIAASAGTVPVSTLAAGAALRVVSDGTNWQAC